MAEIVILFNTEQARRKIFIEVLSRAADIKFLSDIEHGERAGVLGRAEVVTTMRSEERTM